MVKDIMLALRLNSNIHSSSPNSILQLYLKGFISVLIQRKNPNYPHFFVLENRKLKLFSKSILIPTPKEQNF